MVIPTWLQKYIDSDELQSLERKVAQLEATVDVELVPVIVKSSSTYPQTKITVALVLALIFLELWYLLDVSIYWESGYRVFAFIAVFFTAVFGLSPWIAKFGFVQMLLTHKAVEEEQCWRRAEMEFQNCKVSSTKQKNGILVYISLLERRVIVKGDRAIYEKIDPQLWNQAVQKIIGGMKQKQMARGISDALDAMESLLKLHFPVNIAGKSNELPNTFSIKE
ncbi:MAG: TPM domain-containing protein [Bdellovibrionaceae bacterium]|nr:TPM domain-containing protein [Pseudobdellovibrionaceae bacterium]